MSRHGFRSHIARPGSDSTIKSKDKAEYTQTVNLLPCTELTKGATLHAESFADGSKLEILCQGGEYRQKLTLKNGTVGWTGKCPYTNGHPQSQASSGTQAMM